MVDRLMGNPPGEPLGQSAVTLHNGAGEACQCETPIINVNTTTRRRRRRSFASTTTTTTSASSPPPGLALPASRHHQHVHCRRRRRRRRHDRRRTPAVNSRSTRRIRGKTTERPGIQSNLRERFGSTPGLRMTAQMTGYWRPRGRCP